jgi:hypothetical protein
LSFLPALRTPSNSGLLDVTWYTRASVTTVNTNVAAAVGVSPVTTATPPNLRITNAASNWLANSSLIVPNSATTPTMRYRLLPGHPSWVALCSSHGLMAGPASRSRSRHICHLADRQQPDRLTAR